MRTILAFSALDLLQLARVDAIIGPQNSEQVNFVMNLGKRAQVPIVSFSATSPSLAPRVPFFVQTSQSDAFQVQAIASIIESFKWNQVVVINEDTEYGNGIIPYLLNALNDVNARISYRSVVPETASEDFISKELYKMMGMQTRVFVVHASQSLGTKLFPKLRELGMISTGYAWIVTSGLTDLFHSMDFEVVEFMRGFLGVKPLVPNSKQLRSFAHRWIRTFHRENSDLKVTETSIFGLWAYDTLWALAMAAESIASTKPNLVTNKNSGNAANPFALESSEMGPKLRDALLHTGFFGLAGEFKLVNEQLVQTPYQIVNFDGNHERLVATWRPYVENQKEGNLNETNSYFPPKVKFGSIIWPGDSTVAPKGWQIPVSGRYLRVGVPKKPGFNEFLKVEMDPTTNAVRQVSGCYRKVFDDVMAALPYAVIHEYVPYPFFNANGSAVGNYNDLVNQVHLQEQFDAAIGDITITYERSLNVDFTMPYVEGGVTCIVPIIREYDQYKTLTIFTLFTKNLWMTAVVFYLANALAIWILGRRILSESREAPGQHPGMIGYFPFFPGQGLNANLLCLILVAWVFASSLLYATLTARITSALVVPGLRPGVRDVSELIANGHRVGCQQGSFVFRFLIDLGFRKSKISNYSSTELADKALGSGNISAFCDTAPHIRLLLYCGKYMAIEPTYRTEGFAFAFPRGSPLVSDVSRAILKLTSKNNSIIQDIMKGCIENATCLVSDSSPGSSTAANVKPFVVPFIFSACITVACLLLSELADLRKKGLVLDQKMPANVCSRIQAALPRLLYRWNSALAPILPKKDVGQTPSSE